MKECKQMIGVACGIIVNFYIDMGEKKENYVLGGSDGGCYGN